MERDDEVQAEACSCCGGELRVLGELGRLLWLVCRACGMQFSRKADGE